MTNAVTTYEDYISNITGNDFKMVLVDCRIIRAFVSQPQLSKKTFVSSSGDKVEGLPFWTAPASVPSKTVSLNDKQVDLPNPNFYESSKYCIFVAMEGKNIKTKRLNRWVVRFRLFDRNLFLKRQDLYQLRSLCEVISGNRYGIERFYNDDILANDPLQIASAVCRRLNCYRDALFTSFGLPKKTTPLNRYERPKKFWSWCFSDDASLSEKWFDYGGGSSEINGNGHPFDNDRIDLVHLESGNAKPLQEVASRLVSRLLSQVSLQLTDNITEETVKRGTPIFIGARTKYYPYLYEPEEWEDMDSHGPFGFYGGLSDLLLAWTIRQGYDQLVIPTDDEFGNPFYAGPAFELYSPQETVDRNAWGTITNGGFRAQSTFDISGDVLSGCTALPIFKLPHKSSIYSRIAFKDIIDKKKEETQSVEATMHELFDD